MFVNVSPAVYNLGETLCSLNFASRCRNVELGQAKKQVTAGSSADDAGAATPASASQKAASATTAVAATPVARRTSALAATSTRK